MIFDYNKPSNSFIPHCPICKSKIDLSKTISNDFTIKCFCEKTSINKVSYDLICWSRVDFNFIHLNENIVCAVSLITDIVDDEKIIEYYDEMTSISFTLEKHMPDYENSIYLELDSLNKFSIFNNSIENFEEHIKNMYYNYVKTLVLL